MKKLRIGTRGSALALWQARHVASLLEAAHPELRCEEQIFKTRGDHILDRPLSEVGGKGLFTKELEVRDYVAAVGRIGVRAPESSAFLNP